jgi:2-polyprenyl-6-methoxyphenol hydroxylase-like FAD-dependent oxidoreductase
MDIAIFGAGVAGLAAAAALSHDGHRCRIFERRALARAGEGMALLLPPSVGPDLAALGVPAGAGVVLQDYRRRDAAGRLLGREALAPGTRCIPRQRLLQDLASALGGRAVVEYGSALLALDRDAGGQVLRARLSTGESVRADLYLAADGSRSIARAALCPDQPARLARVHEIVGVIEDDECAAWAGMHFNKFHAPAEGLAFGLLPMQGRQLVWYLQFDSARRTPAAPADAAALAHFAARCVGRWGPPIPRLLARSDFARVHLWRPVQAAPGPRLHAANLVLCGDAALPLLPFTSQGTAAALADVSCLRRALHRGAGLADALAAYSAERLPVRHALAGQGAALLDGFLRAGGSPAVPIAGCP